MFHVFIIIHLLLAVEELLPVWEERVEAARAARAVRVAQHEQARVLSYHVAAAVGTDAVARVGRRAQQEVGLQEGRAEQRVTDGHALRAHENRVAGNGVPDDSPTQCIHVCTCVCVCHV